MVTPSGFGRYRIEGELGRGGMGIVYRARDPELDREVAVKHILLPVDASRELRDELEKRFRREAKAAARIRHPGVVAIHDVGATETGLYLVMELVDGESLAHRLQRGSFPDREAAIEVAARTADALAAAHRAGVVHRDVKPANILISRDGRVMITDFGVARGLDEVSELTRTGMVVGSPAYMAPEQLQGAPVDGRADIFSLGVVLYEMLLRKRPFPAQSITTLLYQILHEDPLADAGLGRDLDAATADVLRRMLAKRPEDRFSDAGELAAALRRLEVEPARADEALTRHMAFTPPPPPLPPSASTPPRTPAYSTPPATPTPYASPAPAIPAAYPTPTPTPHPPPPPYAPQYTAQPTPTAAAAPSAGIPRAVLWALAAGVLLVGLVVVGAAFLLWNRAPQRPIVQPPQPAAWNPTNAPIPEPSLPATAPTSAPLSTMVPAATLGMPIAPTPPPAATVGAPVAPTHAAPAPTEPPRPLPSVVEVQPPVATPPPRPREEPTIHLKCRVGVELDIAPGEAIVTLDGKRLGTADDVDEFEIKDPGVHYIWVSHEGYKPVLAQVDVSPDTRKKWVELEVEMEELPAKDDGQR
jgi:serine/threonine-protein kinase